MSDLVTNFFDRLVHILFSSGKAELLACLGATLGLMAVLFAVGKVPLSYNVRNLMVRWKTTVMTALAFTLVVSLMTVMLAFVNGMYQLTEKSGRPGNVIVLADGATDESFSTLSFVDASDIEQEPNVLKDSAGVPLCSKEVFVVVNQEIKVAAGERPRRRFVQVRGVENPAIAGEVHGLALKDGGKWFSEGGVEEVAGGEKGAASNVVMQAVLGN